MFSYSYMPPRDIKKCSGISLCGLLIGFGMIYCSNFLPYSTAFQILGIALLSIAIFLTTRYVVKKYVYSIQKAGEGDYDFVVNEVNGKRSVVACRINIDEIEDFIYSADGKMPGKYSGKTGKAILRYNYCQDIFPLDAYYLYANIREGRVCIKFSPDKKLAEIIESLRTKEILSENKELR
ncbi:MAG: hypothetical protein IJ303_01145 [Clostridia bacterium]|nr:hypothetical protein [Clostridia bacterium]